MLSSCLQPVRVQQRKQRGQEAAGEHLVVVVVVVAMVVVLFAIVLFVRVDHGCEKVPIVLTQ